MMKKTKNSSVSFQKDVDKGHYPALSSMPRVNPFTVPEGYFDRLPAQILEKIDEESATGKTFFLTLRNLRWPYKIALAASLIFIAFTLAYLIFTPGTTQRLISEIQQITAGQLEEFDGYLVNFDESLVDDWVDRKGDGVRQAMVDSTSLDAVTDDDIMNYLLAEYIPDELLLNTQTNVDQSINNNQP
jgi:hypothetical protein